MHLIIDDHKRETSDFLKNKIITDYVGEIYLNSIDRDGTAMAT